MQKKNYKPSSASKKSPYYDEGDMRITKKSSNGKDNWKKYGKSMLKSYVSY